MAHPSRWAALGVAALAISSLGCQAPDGDGGLETAFLPLQHEHGRHHQRKHEKFRFSIDSQLEPHPRYPDGRPLGAVAQEGGMPTAFVLGEVLLATRSQRELDTFLRRHGGVVLRTNAVPEPPSELNRVLTRADRRPTSYVVEIDPPPLRRRQFIEAADCTGAEGHSRMSSEAAARLLQFVTFRREEGLAVSPNFVVDLDAPLLSTKENPLPGGGFEDAFTFFPFWTTGSKSNVTRMWQYLSERPLPRRPWVTIIDAGFWVDEIGAALPTDRLNDFPLIPIQRDFFDDDSVVEDDCCNFHGSHSASVATAIVNNQYGAAGTGGMGAVPMLFRIHRDVGSLEWAIRTAVSWGTDVISMSLSMSCPDYWCDQALEPTFYPALRNARDNGVVMVAAAGNDGDSGQRVPCKAAEDIICVGALEDDTNVAASWSNFGPNVNLWAPTDIPVAPDGFTFPDLALATGTSASTPFVAGIAAMMKGFDPGLSSGRVRSILRETAWTDSPDPKVTHHVNAFRAVRAAAGGETAPTVTFMSPPTDALLGRQTILTVVVSDAEEGVPCAGCVVTWDPAPISSGLSAAAYRFGTAGPRTVTATARDSSGLTGSASITFNVVNVAPTAYIESPVAGGRIVRGVPTTLVGYGLDVNEGPGPGEARIETRCQWLSSDPSDVVPDGPCTSAVTFARVGAHTLTLRVRDSLDAVSPPATVVFEVVEPSGEQGPNAFFALPEPNYETGYGSDLPLTLAGSGSTDSDVPFTFEWSLTTYQSGSAIDILAGPTVIQSGSSPELTFKPSDYPTLFPTCQLDGIRTRITLRVRDSLGNSGAAYDRLVRVLCRLI